MEADKLDTGLLEKVKDIVKPQYEELKCWAHGWPHIYKVEQHTEIIAEKEGASPIICGISGYTHDLGRIPEERGKVSKDLGKTQNHAYLSVLPTIEILENLGITGANFDDIVGAVAIHSRKDYEGNNIVARILRDSDKIAGLGAWGVLRIGKFMFDMDFEPPDFTNTPDVERVAAGIMEEILQGNGGNFQGKKALEEYLRCVNFNLEWENMMHTPSAREIAAPLFDYNRRMRQRTLDALEGFDSN